MKKIEVYEPYFFLVNYLTQEGRGLSEVQFMMPLSELLGITVNELLSGEKLSADEYQPKAEENMISLIKKNEYVETYTPLVWWFIFFVIMVLFFAFEWNVSENTQRLAKIFIVIIMTLVDVLFAIIFKGEYVYWFVWGPDYETARDSDSQRRKAYVRKYLRIFLTTQGELPRMAIQPSRGMDAALTATRQQPPSQGSLLENSNLQFDYGKEKGFPRRPCLPASFPRSCLTLFSLRHHPLKLKQCHKIFLHYIANFFQLC